MATVKTLAKRSLRLLSVLQVGEDPSSEEAADLVDSLNAMLHGWDNDGLRIGHSDLVWADTIPYEDNHLNAMAYMFAITIAPEFGKQLPTELVEFGRREYSNLRHFYANPTHFDLPSESAENAETYF